MKSFLFIQDYSNTVLYAAPQLGFVGRLIH
jgi:hypothetical protein